MIDGCPLPASMASKPEMGATVLAKGGKDSVRGAQVSTGSALTFQNVQIKTPNGNHAERVLTFET